MIRANKTENNISKKLPRHCKTIKSYLRSDTILSRQNFFWRHRIRKICFLSKNITVKILWSTPFPQNLYKCKNSWLSEISLRQISLPLPKLGPFVSVFFHIWHTAIFLIGPELQPQGTWLMRTFPNTKNNSCHNLVLAYKFFICDYPCLSGTGALWTLFNLF